MPDINTYLHQLQTARLGKDVRQAIHDSIQQCYEDATGNPESVAGVIGDVFTLKSRVDNLATLSEGSTTGDAELIDIRTDCGGITYQNAGDSVRIQTESINNGLVNFNRNFFKTITDFTSGYIGLDGVISASSSYKYTDFISVIGYQGKTLNFAKNSIRFLTAYNGLKQAISNYGREYGGSYTIPDGVAYIRLTVNSGCDSVTINTENSTKNGYLVPLSGLDTDVIRRFNEIDDRFINGFGNFNLGFIETITEFTNGYYIAADGNVTANQNYKYTDYINVKTTSNKNFISNNKIRFVTAYDINKTVIPEAGINSTQQIYNFTLPENVAYIRCTIETRLENLIIKTEGSNNGGYEVTREALDKNLDEYLTTQHDLLETVLEEIGAKSKSRMFSNSSEVMATGETLSIGNAIDVKNYKNLAFYADFETFGSIRIGHGYENYGASYIEIDDAQIKVYSYYNGQTLITTLSHGLTLSNFININIRANLTSAIITVYTKTGKYTSNEVSWSGCNGEVYAYAISGSYTNCKVTWTCDGLNDPLWIFGDSYISLGANSRWPKHIMDLGYDRFLMCGYPGAASSGQLACFKKLLNLSKPKTAVWFLGMNNGDTSASINPTYQRDTEEFISICEANGIYPVISTIPTTPAVNNEYKSQWVRNSGYRYVDFYKAVGTDSSGEWYAGMLSTDNVHPTELGAQTLASRILLDLPEIAYKG